MTCLDRFRFCLLLPLLLLSGCGTGTPEKERPDTEPVRSEVRADTLTLTVEVSADRIRLSDEPTLTVTVLHDPEIEVTLPPFGTAVNDFLIRDFQEPLPSADGNRHITQQIYTLEPTHAGRLLIDPVTVRYRSRGDDTEQTLQSESLTVTVTTVVGDGAPSLDDLRPAAAPVELPSEGPPWWVWAILLGLLAASGVVVWLVRRQRFAQEQVPRLSPQELARQELDMILAGRLASTNVKRFYAELTGVVRRYIERSTGVRAPEQTTEEFLREILQHHTFTDQEQRRLRQFLEAADLVKFAGQQPNATDLESSVKRAQEFIRIERVSSEEDTE